MSEDETTRILKRRTYNIDETVINTQNLNQSQNDKVDDSETKIFRPTKEVSGLGINDKKTNIDFTNEPVVGWIVVVEGFGKGNSLTLGYGMNSIGRNPDERVSINYGDEEISRKSHALLTYDPKGKRFYLNHGGGINLTYIGEDPVLQTIELKGREIISIGNTKLCFIPFCGPEFTW